MSALAQALRGMGARVSGSDRFLDQGRGDLDVLAVLRRAGVQLLPQDGSGATAGRDAPACSCCRRTAPGRRPG